LDYENAANPHEERMQATSAWKVHSVNNVVETSDIVSKASALHKLGLKSIDALHVACAIAAACDYFVTTDDLLLHRAGRVREIKIVDPPTFVREALT
jgi:predicted nucleic acid-binding protein